jgi:hypothetical protein
VATENKSDEEKALDDLANFGPCMDDAQMEMCEKRATSPGYGQGRRLAFVTLARGADVLSKLSLEEPETFGEMRDMVDHFVQATQDLLEMAKAAQMRLAITDCREGVPI